MVDSHYLGYKLSWKDSVLDVVDNFIHRVFQRTVITFRNQSYHLYHQLHHQKQPKLAPLGNQLYLLNRLSYRPLPDIFGNGRKFPKNCGDVSPVSHPFRRACILIELQGVLGLHEFHQHNFSKGSLFIWLARIQLARPFLWPKIRAS